jgi:hypothetical protein
MAHNSSVLSSVFIVLIHVVVERGVFGCFGQEELMIEILMGVPPDFIRVPLIRRYSLKTRL